MALPPTSRRDALAEWFPVLLRYSGWVLVFLFAPLVWLLTGRIEPLLLGAGMTAAGLGEGAAALRDLTKARALPPQTQPPSETS